MPAMDNPFAPLPRKEVVKAVERSRPARIPLIMAHWWGEGLYEQFDVQHILQEGTPDDVRREVRLLIDTFDRPEGGMCLAAGNGIVAGTPFENIEAFLDEAVRYGVYHRQRDA